MIKLITKNDLSDIRECSKLDYQIDDMYLVRTTDIFPKDKKITSISYDKALSYSDSYIFGDVLYSFGRDIRTKCQVAYEGARSTVHFCLNGLVGNHGYGYFTNRKYIILEPLCYHLNDINLLSLRSEDTYFKDYIDLYEPIIIMSKSNYEEIEDGNDLSDYQIFIYDFNNDDIVSMYPVKFGFGSDYSFVKFEQDLVNYVFGLLNIPCFIISSHGYSDYENSSNMNDLINRVREEYGIDSIIHFNSEIHVIDSNISIENSMRSDLNHFIYVVNNSNVEQYLKDELLSLIPFIEDVRNYDGVGFCKTLRWEDKTLDREYINSKLREFINIIGIEEFMKLTNEYNKSLLNSNKLSRS